MGSNRICSAVGLAVCLAACQTAPDAGPDRARARALIAERSGFMESHDPEQPLTSQEQAELVAEAGRDGLELCEAQRLALLLNLRLQAGFAELGVDRAAFAQAGLLENPSLGLAFLWPSGGGQTRYGFDLLQSVSSLWELEARQGQAQALLDQRILELSRFAGELVAETKAAFFDALAAEATLEAARQDAEAAQRLGQLAQRRAALGEIDRLDAGLSRAEAQAAALQAERAALELALARQRLAAQLSLGAGLGELRLIEPSPAPPEDLDGSGRPLGLESVRRLDLAALEASIAAARADLDLERQRRRRPQTQAGLSGERPERGSAMTFLTGLAGSIRLPIFDQNLAQVARAQARLESLEKQRAALAAEIELELSAARQRRAAAEQAVREIESGLLSSASENRALAERLFELGERDLAARLEAQRTWLRARRLLIEARLERGRSELALERALGASLDAP